MANFSGAIKIGDLNDFIAPSQACVLNLEGKPVQTDAPDPLRKIPVSKPGEGGFKQTTTDATTQAIKVSLQDCLACSGCVTTAETMLLQNQSTDELLLKLQDPFINVVASISQQSIVSLAAMYELPVTECAERLTGFLKGLGVSKVLSLHTARSIALAQTATDFVGRLRAAYPAIPSARASTKPSYIDCQQQAPLPLLQGQRSTPGTLPWALPASSHPRSSQLRASQGITAPSSTEPCPDSTADSPRLPLLISACPGWVCYAEKTHGEWILPYLCSAKSPQAVAGTLIKGSTTHLRTPPPAPTPPPHSSAAIMECGCSAERDSARAAATCVPQDAVAGGADATGSGATHRALNGHTPANGQRQDKVHRVMGNSETPLTKSAQTVPGAGATEPCSSGTDLAGGGACCNGTAARADLPRARVGETYHVAIMPCFDKKLEAAREDLTVGAGREGDAVPETDSVLTTSEVHELLTERGVQLREVERAAMDAWQGVVEDSSWHGMEGHVLKGGAAQREGVGGGCGSAEGLCGCSEEGGEQRGGGGEPGGEGCCSKRAGNSAGDGKMPGVRGGSGGYLEYAVKHAVWEMHGLDLGEGPLQMKVLRNSDLQEVKVEHGGRCLLAAARAYGFRNIQNLVRKIKAGTCPYDIVEVMACPSGCLNGGGQIKIDGGQSALQDHLKKLDGLFHDSNTMQLQWPVQDNTATSILRATAPGKFSTVFHHREKTVHASMVDW